MFVLDASVALSHSLAEREFRDQARRIMAALETQTALVPAIWCLELASGLLKKERGKVVTKKEVDDTLLRWSKLPVKADTSGLVGTFTETLTLARKHNISVYDASYVETRQAPQPPHCELRQCPSRSRETRRSWVFRQLCRSVAHPPEPYSFS